MVSARLSMPIRQMPCSKPDCDNLARETCGNDILCGKHATQWRRAGGSSLVILVCKVCSSEFPKRGRAITCGPTCARIWQFSWKKRIKTLPGGAEFLRDQQKKRRSTPEAKEKLKERERGRVSTPEKLEKERARWRAYDAREEVKARRKIADHQRHTSEVGRLKIRTQNRKRRALIRAQGYVPYQEVDIFVRDGNKCQICGGALRFDKVWPHPKSPSIDHILPISKGGADVPSNVQSAHLSCNLRKHTNAEGQLWLEII